MKGVTYMNQVVLYGILKAEDSYRVARYFVLKGEYITITNIINFAIMMKGRYPSIEHVYAVDNRYGLKDDFMKAFKHPSIENNIVFKDICEREGLKVI